MNFLGMQRILLEVGMEQGQNSFACEPPGQQRYYNAVRVKQT